MKTHPACIEALEQRIAPVADLIVDIVGLKLPPGGVTVPGDIGSVTFDVTNIGSTRATSGGNGAKMDFFLSTDAVLSGGDTFVGSVFNIPIGLESGQAKRLTGFFGMPELVLPTPTLAAGNYRLIVQIDATNVVAESSGANNTDATDPFSYVFQFGNVGTRKNVPLAIGPHAVHKFTLSGPGTGELTPDGTRVDLVFNNTDGKSAAKLLAKVRGDILDVDLDDITANSPLGSLTIFFANTRGDLRFLGGLGSLTAGVIEPPGGSVSDTQLTIAAGLGKPVNLDIFALGDVDITSAVGIASLETHFWRDTGAGADTITAPFINKLYVTKFPAKVGTVPIEPVFSADLFLTGDPSVTYVLNDAKLAGLVMDSTWTLNNTTDLDVNKIKLEKAEDWKLVVSGMVKTLVVQRWDNTGTPGAMLDALTAGDVIVGEITGDSIILRGSDGVNVAAKRMVLADVKRLDALSAMQGGIETLATYRWEDDTAIQTEWIKTLAVLRGLDSRFLPNLTLTGAGPSGASLATAFVANTMDGTWTAAAGFGRLEFDHLEGTLNSQTFIDSIKADDIKTGDIDAVGEIRSLVTGDWNMGSLEASELKSLSINGQPSKGSGKLKDVTFRLQEAGGVTDRFAVAGLMQNVNIFGSSTYIIESLTADAWNGGALDVGSVGKLALDGKLAGSNGFLLGVNIDLRSRSVEAGGGSLKELKVAGAVDTTQIDLAFEAGKVTVGKFLESEFNVQGDVKSFIVTGAGGGIEPASFKNSLVSGHTFGTIAVVDVASAGPGPYGFDTQGIVSYKRKEAGAVVATLAGPANGIYDVLGNYAVTVA